MRMTLIRNLGGAILRRIGPDWNAGSGNSGVQRYAASGAHMGLQAVVGAGVVVNVSGPGQGDPEGTTYFFWAAGSGGSWLYCSRDPGAGRRDNRA